jgi:hypothetical protein
MSNRSDIVRPGSIGSIFAAVALFAAYFNIAVVRAGDVTTPPPDGWWIYKTGELDGSARRCGNFSSREWIVTPSESMIKITQRGDQSEQGKGTFQFEPYAGGQLEGVDVGEFAGGLWWIAPDGKTKIQVSDERVHGFARTDYGVFVLTGLDHMGLYSGKILRMSDEGEGPPTTSVVTDMGESTQAFAAPPDGSVIIATSSKVLRLKSPGTVGTLRPVDFGGLYPISIAAMPDGTIYISARMFVARLTPNADSFQLDWLLPANCPRFEQKGTLCLCLAP